MDDYRRRLDEREITRDFGDLQGCTCIYAACVPVDRLVSRPGCLGNDATHLDPVKLEWHASALMPPRGRDEIGHADMGIFGSETWRQMILLARLWAAPPHHGRAAVDRVPERIAEHSAVTWAHCTLPLCQRSDVGASTKGQVR